MKMPGTDKLLQAASCFLCAAVAWKYSFDLDGTEFSGGRITGPLLTLHFGGSILLVLALILVFIYPRVAAISSLVAALLCLPLYLYFTAPGVFRQFFPGTYSVPVQATFVWDGMAVAGILTIAAMAYLSLRRFLENSANKIEKNTMKAMALVFLSLLLLPSVVFAGQFREVNEAYVSGDSQTAFKKLEPLAALGNR